MTIHLMGEERDGSSAGFADEESWLCATDPSDAGGAGVLAPSSFAVGEESFVSSLTLSPHKDTAGAVKFHSGLTFQDDSPNPANP